MIFCYTTYQNASDTNDRMNSVRKAISNEMAAYPIPDLALGSSVNRRLLQCDMKYDLERRREDS